MHKFHNHIIGSAVIVGFLGLSVLTPSLTHAQSNDIIVGVPVVEDSGTLLMNGQKLSLWGIDTLAPDQQCWEDGMAWCCGEHATLRLKHFIHGRAVECTKVTAGDETTPPLVKCTRQKAFRKKDLAKHLVRRGLALDKTGTYKQDEQKAKKRKNGIWSGKFQTAQDWKDGVQRFVGEK